MARCVVLHRATNSEHCRQGIKCIKKAQEVINTAGNSKSDGLKIYRTRWGSRICARMQIGAINKLEGRSFEKAIIYSDIPGGSFQVYID